MYQFLYLTRFYVSIFKLDTILCIDFYTWHDFMFWFLYLTRFFNNVWTKKFYFKIQNFWLNQLCISKLSQLSSMYICMSWSFMWSFENSKIVKWIMADSTLTRTSFLDAVFFSVGNSCISIYCLIKRIYNFSFIAFLN